MSAHAALLKQARAWKTRAAHQRLEEHRVLLRAAGSLVGDRLDHLADEARVWLHQYEGLPPRVEPWETLGVGAQEPLHTQQLAWLLDPAGSHQLGGAVLSWLLARCGLHRAAVGRASVQAERPVGGGYVDVWVELDDLVLVIELKVWDTEHRVGGKWQTTAYREGAVAETGRPVRGIFIRPRGREVAKDKQATTLDWLNVERCLARAVRDLDPEPQARHWIDAFRSNLVRVSGAVEPPLPLLERTRLLVGDRRLRSRDPMRSFLVLQSFLEWMRDDT